MLLAQVVGDDVVRAALEPLGRAYGGMFSAGVGTAIGIVALYLATRTSLCRTSIGLGIAAAVLGVGTFSTLLYFIRIEPFGAFTWVSAAPIVLGLSAIGAALYRRPA